jgi:phosphonate degradation associated HDIG domain protein
MDIRDEIVPLFEAFGPERYGGEAVNQLAHALQAATIAEAAGANAALIGAALLHDIGHLVDGGDEGMADRGLDWRHEDRGAEWLAAWFPPAVTEPIRLHVTAKRCLCALDAGYWDHLSRASKVSMAVQGGPMTREAAEAFMALPFAEDAIALRRWDDLAKDPEGRTPPLDHFVAILQDCCTA